MLYVKNVEIEASAGTDRLGTLPISSHLALMHALPLETLWSRCSRLDFAIDRVRYSRIP